MRFKHWTLTYRFTYLLFWLGMYGYYRKVKIRGLKNIPKNKPILFVSNHQNSLVDPCVLAVTRLKPVYFLARSDVFGSPFVSKILGSLNMMPIYRKRDGNDFQMKNKAIFEKCFEILKQNGRIIIFPEGSHDKRKHLRELKSGVARIGIGASSLYKELDVYIVPVGLNYTNTVNKWADLYINYGQAIRVKDYDSFNDASDEIMLAIRSSISNLMIDIENEELYSLCHYILFDSKFIPDDKVLETYNTRKNKLQKLKDWIEEHKTRAYKLNEKTLHIKQYCEDNKIRPYLFNEKNPHKLGMLMVLILGFPLFLYGWINNEIPFRAPRRLNAKLKDDQFHSPIYLILGAFLCGICWTVQTIIFYYFILPSFWWLYLLSLPITGWIAFRYYILLKKFIGKNRYYKLNKTNAQFVKAKETHEELKEIYKGLK